MFKGDRIDFCGEYEWNSQGGVVHLLVPMVPVGTPYLDALRHNTSCNPDESILFQKDKAN